MTTLKYGYGSSPKPIGAKPNQHQSIKLSAPTAFNSFNTLCKGKSVVHSRTVVATRRSNFKPLSRNGNTISTVLTDTKFTKSVAK